MAASNGGEVIAHRRARRRIYEREKGRPAYKSDARPKRRGARGANGATVYTPAEEAFEATLVGKEEHSEGNEYAAHLNIMTYGSAAHPAMSGPRIQGANALKYKPVNHV